MKVTTIRAQAAALYLGGLSIEDVARELHVCYRTARKAILRSGVVLRDPSARLIGRTRPDKAQAAARVPDVAGTGLVEYQHAPATGQATGEPWN